MKSFPQDLIDAFNSDEVVCVVGSGPSVAAGFPSWLELLELMIDECEKQLVGFKQGRELRKLLKQGYLLEVADECSKLLSGQSYRDFFQRIFRQESIRPSKLHRLFCQLPFSAVLTTNYDNLIERAYIARSHSNTYPLVYTQKNVVQLPRLASEKRFFVFKMHGDADDVQTIVLTKRDYQEVIHKNDLYRTALSQILATRTALFIGYGLRDHDLNLILGEQATLFKAYGRRHYALLPDPGMVLPKSLLEHYNITVIPYSGKSQHAELEKLIQGLIKQVKKAPITGNKNESHKLKQLIETEREFCHKLGTHIELERARFIKSHASDLLNLKDKELIEESIVFWEQVELNRKNLEDQLRQSQKMEAVGQLAGGVAHDFNNILAVIKGYSDLIASEIDPESPLRKYTEEIRHAAESADGLTRQLLIFTRKQEVQAVVLDLNDVVKDLDRMLRRLIGENIEMTIVPGKQISRINADAGYIGQVLMNLVVNARDAMPKGGLLKIQIETVNIDNGRLIQNPDARIGTFIQLSVSDTGCGIPPENFQHIFEPFFTTKEIGKGTGLGLATVYNIIKQYQGWIEFESTVGKGTTFRIYFPHASLGQTEMEKPTTQIPIIGGNETILVVEDEKGVRELVSHILQKYGYKVLQAEDAAKAMEIWRKKKNEINLLLTDLIMPGHMNGREFAEKLWAEQPSLKVIFSSGYRADIVGKDFKLEPGLNFLPKPYQPQTLALAVRAFLDTGHTPSEPTN